MEIYVTSKIRHSRLWSRLMVSGVPIRASWIELDVDLSSEDEIQHLWDKCFEEVKACTHLVAYVEPGDLLKGGLGEIALALALGKPVLLIGDVPELGTLARHRNIKRFDSLESAFKSLGISVDVRSSVDSLTSSQRSA